jgi:hypothetical protein
VADFSVAFNSGRLSAVLIFHVALIDRKHKTSRLQMVSEVKKLR